MSGNVNVKIKQEIKNVKLQNSSLKSKLRLRFKLPANIIINLRARQKVNNPDTKATQSLKVREAETPKETSNEQ